MKSYDCEVLIEIYRNFQNKENTLNVRFQDLVFESSNKRKELENIKIQFLHIKDNSSSYSVKRLGTTFNLLKSNETLNLTSRKQDEILKLGALGFRIQAFLNQLLSKNTNLIAIIHQKSLKYEDSLADSIKASQDYLEVLKTNESLENTQGTQISNTDKLKTFSIEAEAEAETQLKSSSVHLLATKKTDKLRDVFLSYFPDSKAHAAVFTSCLEEDYVAKNYLNDETLQNYLSLKTAEEAVRCVTDLLKMLLLEHIDKICVVMRLNKDLLGCTQKSFESIRSKATKYLLKDRPDLLDKFKSYLEIDRNLVFIKDPKFNTKFRKIYRSQTNEGRVIYKPIDRSSLRKSTKKAEPSYECTQKKSLNNSSNAFSQPIFSKRRAMSIKPSSNLTGPSRTKEILQEVLTLDQKMKFLNFQEKKISREVKKFLPLTARLPIKYSVPLSSITYKSVSSTRPATSHRLAYRTSSLDLNESSNPDLIKRLYKRDNVI